MKILQLLVTHFLVICRVLATKVVGATSSECFLVHTFITPKQCNISVIKAKFHYTDPTLTRHGPDTDKVRARCRVRAKFHYTDPTGPARTRTDFFAAKLRWVRAGPFGSVSMSVSV